MAEPRNSDRIVEDHPKRAVEDAMDVEANSTGQSTARVAGLLRRFLAVQRRRAKAYSKLRRRAALDCLASYAGWDLVIFLDHTRGQPPVSFLVLGDQNVIRDFGTGQKTTGISNMGNKNTVFLSYPPIVCHCGGIREKWYCEDHFGCIKLKKNINRGFSEYMTNGGELAYQQVCGNVTGEFNDCSKQILEMVALLSMPDFCRGDLANLLKDVQAHEKDKLQLTVRIQVLKKAGRPSECLVNHADCRSSSMAQHTCVHLKEITEAAGTEDAEAEAEYDGALKDAKQGVQEAVTCINEHMEEVCYEIESLEAEVVGSRLTEVEEAFPDTLLIK